MGYVGKLQQKLLAQKLRSKGYSYKEILQEVPVSKDTISKWCRDIPLSQEQKEKLMRNKVNGQRKGSMVAADNKKVKRLKEIEQIKMKALTDIGTLTDKEEFLTGIALYAAEGTKRDTHGAFSNADPLLIKFMSRWFVKYAKVPIPKLRGRIWIHENLNEQDAKEFWSFLSRIPLTQFIKTYKVARKSSTKYRKNIHSYGVFTISFSDATIHRKIMGWISGVFDDKIA